MCPQAIVNPDDLSNFARELKTFNDQLQVSSRRVYGQFKRLGETWKDQEHQKFAHEFEETIKIINRFLQTSNQHVPFLLRKADRIREYLQQK